MGYGSLSATVILLWCFLLSSGTYQSQTSQTGVLLQLRKHLEYPAQLRNWKNYEGVGDLCNLPSSLQVTITCHESFVTELRILGDKHAKVSSFNGYGTLNKTLSGQFSVDSFITTLTKLSNLKVLSLVSLGIWGLLPDKVHRLYSLELLDLSSNFFYGSIPPKLSKLVKLQSLTLDGNFFNDTHLDCLKPLLKLTSLSVKSNRLKGRIPSSITSMKALTYIAMSDNDLHGKLPDLRTLTSLRVVNLMNNRLDSDLSALPTGLVTVLLGKNHFSGKIPQQFGKLRQLQHLDLSFNSLSGIPTPALFSLPNISYLNLASNKLNGLLPDHLRCGKELGFVDISGNKLTGSLPSCLEIDSKDRVVNIDGNCFAIHSKTQHHQSYCEISDEKKKLSMEKKGGILVGLVAGVIIILSVLAFGVFTSHRIYYSRITSQQHTRPKVTHDHMAAGMTDQVLASARFISEVACLGREGSQVYKPFSFEELQEATNNFDHSMYLGEGCIGKIFKGKLKNGSHVAIRLLSFLKKYPIQNLKLKLDMLSRLQHQHLVGLLGHCIDDSVHDASCFHEIFLIYEYVPTKNFHAHLSESSSLKVLKWSDRLAVLIGVARAVHYLHTGVIPGIFNNNLKTCNILLDEHHVAKLSDYGMSIFMEETEEQEAKHKRPTSWHISGLSDDVYNFGLILLETLVGPIIAGKGEAFLLNQMASFGIQDGKMQIVDPVVLSSAAEESLSTVISITNKCISPESSTRPSFEDVLWHLQYAAQVQATADADQKSDTTTES